MDKAITLNAANIIKIIGDVKVVLGGIPQYEPKYLIDSVAAWKVTRMHEPELYFPNRALKRALKHPRGFIGQRLYAGFLTDCYVSKLLPSTSQK